MFSTYIDSTLLPLFIVLFVFTEIRFVLGYEQCLEGLFCCISARLGLHGIFSRCFSVPFLIISKTPITTGIVTVFICHSFSTSISRSLYLDTFSNSATETFLSARIFTSINLQVFSLLSITVMSGLFALIFLSVCML